jgi:hypothetical protein
MERRAGATLLTRAWSICRARLRRDPTARAPRAPRDREPVIHQVCDEGKRAGHGLPRR